MTCPEGLYFNPDLLVCDFDSNNECIVSKSSKFSCTKMLHRYEIAICLYHNYSSATCTGEKGNYYPDPEDCSKFYECFDGVPLHWECPNGLLFNPELLVCDWSDNVDCAASDSGEKNYINYYIKYTYVQLLFV